MLDAEIFLMLCCWYKSKMRTVEVLFFLAILFLIGYSFRLFHGSRHFILTYYKHICSVNKFSSLHLNLFKSEGRYFLNSSNITFLYIYLHDNEKNITACKKSFRTHFKVSAYVDNNMCIIN